MIQLIFIFASIVQISSLTPTVTPSPSSNSVRIYKGRGLTGESKKVEVSSCVSLLHDPYDDHIASIDTMGSCVMVYSDYNCLGNGSLAATFSKTHHHNIFYYGFTINSLGPCRANCPSPNFENGITRVTISTESGAQIFNNFVVVTGECINFPNSYGGTPERIGLTRPLCIQMYEDKGCSGNSERFRVPGNSTSGPDSDDDLDSNTFKILPIKWQTSKSLSLCNFNCIGSKNSSISNIQPTEATSVSPKTLLTDTTSMHANTGTTKVTSTSPITTEKPKTSSPLSTAPVLNEEISSTVTSTATQISETSTGKTITTEQQKVVGQSGSGHFLLWVTMVIVFVSIVTAAEVFRRYKKFRQQNTPSNEFTNMLIRSNGEDYL